MNENCIKEAAYYLWQNAGCPSGQDEKFWSMAIEQLSSGSKSKCNCTKKSCASSTSATKKSSSVKSSKSSKK